MKRAEEHAEVARYVWFHAARGYVHAEAGQHARARADYSRALALTFSRGSLEFLFPENNKVLAFLRRHEDETILVVVNLNPFHWEEATVNLDLEALRVEPGNAFEVSDLITDTTYVWHGASSYVRLDPFDELGRGLARPRIALAIDGHKRQPMAVRRDEAHLAATENKQRAVEKKSRVFAGNRKLRLRHPLA